MSDLILESLPFPPVEVITESVNEGGEKKLYMKGVFCEAEVKNRNGRTYDLGELTENVKRFQELANNGRHVLGELDHPDRENSSEVLLKHVSHKFTELYMQGNQAVGKAEVLGKTTAGGILKGLIESEVNVGFSSRGRGKVGGDGRVKGFYMQTIDAVAVPSASSAHPVPIMEAFDMYRRNEIVTDLHEASKHDPFAQKYFEIEMRKFINSLKL